MGSARILALILREWLAGVVLNLSIRLMTRDMIQDFGPHLMVASRERKKRCEQRAVKIQKRGFDHGQAKRG